MSMANIKSGEYHFPISFVACWTLIYGILYTVELVPCFLSSQDFCNFLSINLLMFGFRLVYEFLYWIYLPGVLLLQL